MALCCRFALLATFSALRASAALSTPATERVDAALDGMQRYFFNASGGFYKSCGQNGGLGKASSHFECACVPCTSLRARPVARVALMPDR